MPPLVGQNNEVMNKEAVEVTRPVAHQMYGQVREVRKFKWGCFLIVDTHKGIPSQWQCVLRDPSFDVKVGSWVGMNGTHVAAKVERPLTVSMWEFRVDEIDIISAPIVDPPIIINEKEPSFSLHNAFEHRGLSLQTETYRRIFKVQSQVETAFRDFFGDLTFTSIHTPKIVSEGAEGGTDVFSLDYFGRKAFLTQSPQFYKQICCAAFGRVYEVGPVFRAEPHASSRHLNEYISLDVEMMLDLYPFSPLQQLLMMENIFLTNMTSSIDGNIMSKLVQQTVNRAKEILGTSGEDMTSNEEIEIGRWAKEEHESDTIFLTHYHRDVRPFYTKLSEDGIHTESFDCIFKGIEITSGGQRVDKHEDYVAAMKAKGLDPANFSFYLENFKYGFPVHGGFAIGLERLTAKICDLPSVKMASLFPRDAERLTP